jgi:hypothetical protein
MKQRLMQVLADFPDVDGIPMTFTRDELRAMLALRIAVERLCCDAECYIDIGWDTANESANLREAIQITREILSHEQANEAAQRGVGGNAEE